MNRLREVRELRGMTQTKLGEMVGAMRHTISRYESGDREPDNTMLVKLANVLDCSVDYLLGNSNDPTPPIEKVDAVTIDSAAKAIHIALCDILGREPNELELAKFKEFAELFVKGLDKQREY